MIFNPHACDFDPTDLVCTGAKNDTCLSSAQASAVQTALSGPKASNGRQVYPGYLYDTGITFTGAGIPGVLNGAASPVGPRVPPTAQDVDAEAAQVAMRSVDARRYELVDEPKYFLRTWRQAIVLSWSE